MRKQTILIASLVLMFALNTVAMAQTINGVEYPQFTEEDIEKIRIFEEAFIESSIGALMGTGKACGFIAFNTIELLEKQEIDGFYIATIAHVIPVIKTSQGFYGLQNYHLKKCTSYDRNWTNRTIYSGGTLGVNSEGAGRITNREHYSLRESVFVDIVCDTCVEKMKHISIPTLKSELEAIEWAMKRNNILYGFEGQKLLSIKSTMRE